MIDKIKLLPAEKWWPETTESLNGKVTLMIRKINEIVDLLNKWEIEGIPHEHLNIGPAPGYRRK
jgi:hypothetical protein